MQRFLSRLSILCLLCALPACAQFGIFKPSKPATKPTPENPLAGHASKQPDKELFDKALIAMKKGKFDVARLDLQTLLNTYPESEYQMRAKLLVGDSWFKEGGTAALTQAEAEYKDFITFFPNTPEAAEAQMKVADIYYMQMEKPDRDPKNAQQAEQEYRNMIQQFPDSTFVPRAKQRLREVQEVLAERQYQVGSFYATHENWAATIARLQTVTDSYPLYSHSDLALIGLGDAYAAEARYVQGLKQINPKAKQELMKAYDDQAADAYSRVVTHYSMAAHVEDARERLIALNRPVPEPTKEELAESEAEEQSRTGITFKDRALSAGQAWPGHGERCPHRRTYPDRSSAGDGARGSQTRHAPFSRPRSTISRCRRWPLRPALPPLRWLRVTRRPLRLPARRCSWRTCRARIAQRPQPAAADRRLAPKLSARARITLGRLRRTRPRPLPPCR